MPSPFPSDSFVELNQWLEAVTKIGHAAEAIGAVPAGLREIAGLARTEIPVRRHCVYFLCAGEEVIYVGQTSLLGQRLQQHLSAGVIDFDRAFFVDVPAERLDEVERAFILLYAPRVNATLRGPDRILGVADREWEALRVYVPGLKRPPPPDDERRALLVRWRGVSR